MRQLHQRDLITPEPARPDAPRSVALGPDARRHARLFEMIRQQSLAERALRRLHLQSLSQDRRPIPTPSSLCASFDAQPACEDSDASPLS